MGQTGPKLGLLFVAGSGETFTCLSSPQCGVGLLTALEPRPFPPGLPEKSTPCVVLIILALRRHIIQSNEPPITAEAV